MESLEQRRNGFWCLLRKDGPAAGRTGDVPEWKQRAVRPFQVIGGGAVKRTEAREVKTSG